MSCPSCGGLSRNPIAPGYWQCTSIITETAVVGQTWVPGGAGGQMVPMPQYGPVSRTCGTRYHEGSGMTSPDAPRCDCNTYAIGSCSECDQPVCGDHSSLFEQRRLCLNCLRHHQGKADVAQQERERAAAERAQQVMSAHVAAMRAISDPIERLLTAMSTVKAYTSPTFGGYSPGGVVGPWERQLVERYGPFLAGMGPSDYDSAAIGRWFAACAAERELPATSFAVIVEERKLLGGHRNVTQPAVRAWTFPQAIAQYSRWGQEPASALFILEDGRMYTPRPVSAAGEQGPSIVVGKLPPLMLKRMADALRLNAGAPAPL